MINLEVTHTVTLKEELTQLIKDLMNKINPLLGDDKFKFVDLLEDIIDGIIKDCNLQANVKIIDLPVS